MLTVIKYENISARSFLQVGFSPFKQTDKLMSSGFLEILSFLPSQVKSPSRYSAHTDTYLLDCRAFQIGETISTHSSVKLLSQRQNSDGFFGNDAA